MATTKVVDVSRPIERAFDTTGEFDDGDPTGADFLSVLLDYNSDGRIVAEMQLYFADYAGLETEWDAGTATTVLEAAIVSALASFDWPDDPLTSAQRTVATEYVPTS